MNDISINGLRSRSYFNRAELLQIMRKGGDQISDATFKRRLQQYLKDRSIIRIGRNKYCIPDKAVGVYTHEYSAVATETADLIEENYPLLDFSIFELVQLNEFVNHQLAHNIIFVSVEADIIDFVFEKLKERFPGRVLVQPTIDLYHRYWQEGMIILEKLVSEAPMGKPVKWHARVEKMLVDIMADRLILGTVSPSEYPDIYTDVFGRYIVDESCMLRYAKRRGAEKEIRELIQTRTDITLRTES